MTKTIPWNVGGGNLIVTYTGQAGSETVTIASDTVNKGEDRSQTITLRTIGENPATAQITVTQPTGMLILRANGVILRDASGNILRVQPN